MCCFTGSAPPGSIRRRSRNDFLRELEARSERQIPFALAADIERGLTEPLRVRNPGPIGVRPAGGPRAGRGLGGRGLQPGDEDPGRHPDLRPAREGDRDPARPDQLHGLPVSACKFSNWACNEEDHTTGKPPDPRSFCIQKTLQEIAHGGNIDNQLMFAGHNVFRFRQDPFYSNGFIPTVRQLVDRIATGD